MWCLVIRHLLTSLQLWESGTEKGATVSKELGVMWSNPGTFHIAAFLLVNRIYDTCLTDIMRLI